MICAVVSPHMRSHEHTPEIRTGSSSLTVFMELTSICLCSWCVSSCCLSSIIFDILVIPEKKENVIDFGFGAALSMLEQSKAKSFPQCIR